MEDSVIKCDEIIEETISMKKKKTIRQKVFIFYLPFSELPMHY